MGNEWSFHHSTGIIEANDAGFKARIDQLYATWDDQKAGEIRGEFLEPLLACSREIVSACDEAEREFISIKDQILSTRPF